MPARAGPKRSRPSSCLGALQCRPAHRRSRSSPSRPPPAATTTYVTWGTGCPSAPGRAPASPPRAIDRGLGLELSAALGGRPAGDLRAPAGAWSPRVATPGGSGRSRNGGRAIARARDRPSGRVETRPRATCGHPRRPECRAWPRRGLASRPRGDSRSLMHDPGQPSKSTRVQPRHALGPLTADDPRQMVTFATWHWTEIGLPVRRVGLGFAEKVVHAKRRSP
jgi:hypothetical protein